MTLKTIAILSPGDMGHGVGMALGQHGYDIITCLAGRSQRTRELAQKGNFREVPTLDALVTEADLILSILVPSQAEGVARSVADAMRATGIGKPFADCNAVSPETSKRLEPIITSAGGDYIDAGIIGGSPARGAEPRFYTSGPHAGIMDELDGQGIAIRNVGGEVGRASSVKMCYASFTKGTSALQVAMMTAAESLGVYDVLVAELSSSQQNNLSNMEGNVPRLPSNAGRWIGEMEEIAATFDAAGVTPHFHLGAAEIFRLLESTPFSQESPETVDQSRTLADTIKVVAEHLPANLKTTD
ncbi:MAG: NAD(P)-dependent oxidoreductase [Chloroflexi bacterium]|nr:NAD(P)-dependent oxidoreductase [Chloroflexota bacterium]